MKYTHIIWDFNGTIFDDVQTGIDSVNKMLAERGLDIIPGIEAYREVFDFPIENYYRTLGFDFDKEPYSVLAPIWVKLYDERVVDAPIVKGVEKTLKRLKEQGLTQVIISACQKDMLCRDLDRLGVSSYFDQIMGLDTIHAWGKTHIARDFAQRNPQAKCLFVGDTTHDAEVARAIGADCVLFSGGHQSRQRLEGCGCPVIDSIEDLLDHI